MRGGGTLPYMAPEQLLGGRLDARTDIWAAGCVLYEMATGRRPFAGSGPALTEGILHGAPPAIAKLNPEISGALGQVIQKCLDKNAARRYQSARQIAADLQRAPAAASTTSAWLRGNWVWTVATAAVIAAAVAGAAWRRQARPERLAARTAVLTARAGEAVPYALYLAGVKRLERWDNRSNLEAAIVLFEQAVGADPRFALGYVSLGEAYGIKYRVEHDGRWLERAETNARRAAELNRELPALYVTLARVHSGKGQYNLALQEVQEALKLAPRDADALLGEAAVYAAMGRQEEAERTYKKAAALRPQHWAGHYELGGFYFRLQRYGEAAAQFERVLEITPDNAMAHATLGGALQLLGKDAEGEKHLLQSIDLQPSYAAYNNLGVLYYGQRRWEESAGMTRKALQLNPQAWRAWSNLRLAYEWLNRRSEAGEALGKELAQLEKMAPVSGDDAEVQAELGLLYAKLKSRRQALPRVEAALALSPEDPAILVCAAEAYDNLGERDRALHLAGEALARGWTLANLRNDPGQRNLLHDPRFSSLAQRSKTQPSPAQPRP